MSSFAPPLRPVSRRNDPDAFYSHHGSLFSGVRPRLVRVRGERLHTALQVLHFLYVDTKRRKQHFSPRKWAVSGGHARPDRRSTSAKPWLCWWQRRTHPSGGGDARQERRHIHASPAAGIATGARMKRGGRGCARRQVHFASTLQRRSRRCIRRGARRQWAEAARWPSTRCSGVPRSVARVVRALQRTRRRRRGGVPNKCGGGRA